MSSFFQKLGDYLQDHPLPSFLTSHEGLEVLSRILHAHHEIVKPCTLTITAHEGRLGGGPLPDTLAVRQFSFLEGLEGLRLSSLGWVSEDFEINLEGEIYQESMYYSGGWVELFKEWGHEPIINTHVKESTEIEAWVAQFEKSHLENTLPIRELSSSPVRL